MCERRVERESERVADKTRYDPSTAAVYKPPLHFRRRRAVGDTVNSERLSPPSVVFEYFITVHTYTYIYFSKKKENMGMMFVRDVRDFFGQYLVALDNAGLIQHQQQRERKAIREKGLLDTSRTLDKMAESDAFFFDVSILLVFSYSSVSIRAQCLALFHDVDYILSFTQCPSHIK